MMEKIGIFGGTFNPIHNGHLHLIRACCTAFSFDRVLLIPAGIPPHKAAEDLAGDEHRLAMCRLAVADDPLISVSDIELHRQGKSYTFDTLTQLKREYPQAEFYLIMGSDMFLTFRSWFRGKEMLQMVTLVTAAREKGQLKKLTAEKKRMEQLGARAFVLDIPVLALSSTTVRERLKKGLDVGDVLDKRVLGYIREHDLYRSGKSRQCCPVCNQDETEE